MNTAKSASDFNAFTLPLPPNQGSADVYVAQLDAGGTWQRVATGGGPGFDYGTAVAVAASGEVVVAANLSSATAAFGTTPALSLPGGNDVAVARFSPATGQWTQAVAGGGNSFEDASGVAVAPDGTVTVAGVFATLTQFGALPALTTAGDADAYVARLSAAGAWTQLVQAGGTGNEQIAAVKVEADGTATVGGTFEGTATFGSLPALASAGQADVFVARLSPGGAWAQALTGGGAGNEQATALSLQGSSATMVGAFRGSATFGTHTVAGGGFIDTFLAHFQGYPDLVVSTTLPGSGGEYNNVTITGTGALFLTSDLIVHGTMTVQGNGSLATTTGSGCAIITGPGNFRLEDRAVFGICSPQGITTAGPTGSVQVLGSRYYDGGATYVYNGPSAQVTGNGLPAVTRNVTSGSGASGLSLSQRLTITEVLYASSDVVLGGQPLVLRSDASGTAVVVNANGRVLGNTAVVQRFINNPYSGVGYRHYSSPVQNATVADLATPNFVPEVSQGAAYNASLAPGLIRLFPTVYRYDESRVANAAITGFSVFDRGWAALVAPTDRLLAGLGYTVHLPGTALVSFRGTLTEGNVQFNFGRGSSPDGGWYLVGNPYPSPLDASTFTQGVVPFQTLENLGTAIYQFRSTGPYAGAYTATVAGLGGSPMIPSGQAFFVRSTQGPGGARASINLNNSNRRTFFSAADNAFARPAADARPRLALSLRGSTGPADPTIVYFDAAATAAFDPAADALKLPNVGNLPNLSTALGPDRYAINGLPPLTATGRVLPLLVNAPAPGRYTLTADELTHFAPGQAIYLTDAATNTRLALTRTATYAFAVTTAGEQTGRFALVFGPAAGPLATALTASIHALTIAPNPAHTAALLTLPAATETRLLTVLDALGRTVQSATVPANAPALTLDVSTLAPGVYVARCGAASARLVVE